MNKVWSSLGARNSVLAAALGCASAACGDRCLVYDYAAPSARAQIRDAATGGALCSPADYIVATNLGPAIAHEDTCEWWLPDWAPTGPNALVAELTLSVTGYEPETVSLGINRNECGVIQPPPVVQVEVEPVAAE